jgi:Ni,Fe-hydrogenase III component G
MTPTEKAIEVARELAERWTWRLETRQPEPNRLDVLLATPADLVPFAVGLRVQRIGWLTAITGLDPGPDSGALELLYHFCQEAAVVTLRLSLPRQGAVVPSLSSIIPSAESSEREVAEMFGIAFDGLRAAGHLYLPDEWPEETYPLRKDWTPPGSDGEPRPAEAGRPLPADAATATEGGRP